MTFEECWNFIVKRCEEKNFPLVQNREELEYVFNLMEGCESYLEVGTAEGNSLYVLAHALPDDALIVSLDFGERHTQDRLLEILHAVPQAVKLVIGDSTKEEIYNKVLQKSSYFNMERHSEIGTEFDCVLIDGGHDFATVLSDAIRYGRLASKFILFHDVCMHEVMAAYKWFVARVPNTENYTFIKSETFGYGIIKL